MPRPAQGNKNYKLIMALLVTMNLMIAVIAMIITIVFLVFAVPAIDYVFHDFIRGAINGIKDFRF
jgi:hypothetical protein